MQLIQKSPILQFDNFINTIISLSIIYYRACLKMQALKEILDNALSLSKKPINMVYLIKEQTFLREYFELSFEFLTIAIVYLL